MKYNKNKVQQPVQSAPTLQGGSGFDLKPELALMNLLANGINNTFYEKESDQEARLVALIKQVADKDPMLVAKMLVYTRDEIGQRSVTHRAAVALLPFITGKPWATDFFSKRDRNSNFGGIVFRVDDMLEIAACYQALNPGKRLPNSLTRGFKLAFENSDAFELARYKGAGKNVKLIDLLNLVKPTDSERNGSVVVDKAAYLQAISNSKKGYQNKPFEDLENGKIKIPALRALVVGLLEEFNTVESKNSKAGQEVAKQVKSGAISKTEGDAKLKEVKEQNFTALTKDGDIGYLALIRNLRNIINSASTKELIDQSVKQLTEVKAIQGSRVFPHQIDLALEVVLAESGFVSVSLPILLALGTAYELSIPNLSGLGAHGKTAVVIDQSSSMSSNIRLSDSVTGRRSAIEKAALIAATLAKGLGADVYGFDYSCRSIAYNPLDSINTIKNIFNKAPGGSTNFGTIFPALANRYDRVFIISDMQGSDSLGQTVVDYKRKYDVDPFVYCIHLCGYSATMAKPGSRVFQVFGYSSEIYDIIKKMEVDPQALLNEVKKINFSQKVKKVSKEILQSEKV
jgi:hypothetical protein